MTTLFDRRNERLAAGASESASFRNDRVGMTTRSALWAAHGDALGWISELTDEAGLRRRTGGTRLRTPVAWKRRVGGRFGVEVQLPAGTYSDDSQLRLATGRAIRPDGFDVEAFAKVELPVWRSYALGGGRATTAAARNLARRRVAWNANSYKGWLDAGGNGAAMRIQPHVWAARRPEEPGSFLLDLVRDAVCSHSHPGGILGAVLHGLALARALATGQIPSRDDLLDAVECAGSVPRLVEEDATGVAVWRMVFEQQAGSLDEAWSREVRQIRRAVQAAWAAGNGSTGAERYEAIVAELGLRDRSRRGSGVLTAVAAVALLWCEEEPSEALRIAANCLGTDTDTIATMAGALLGVVVDQDPPGAVLDEHLFRSEANRLARIALGERPEGPRYPDLDHWSAPTADADALGQDEAGNHFVLGLGRVEADDEPAFTSDGAFAWQWHRTSSGQSLLLKRRPTLPRHRPADLETSLASPPAEPETESRDPAARKRDRSGRPSAVADQTESAPLPANGREGAPSAPPDLERAIAWVRRNPECNTTLGRALRAMVQRGSAAQIGGFVAALIALIRPDAGELPGFPKRHEPSPGLTSQDEAVFRDVRLIASGYADGGGRLALPGATPENLEVIGRAIEVLQARFADPAVAADPNGEFHQALAQHLDAVRNGLGIIAAGEAERAGQDARTATGRSLGSGRKDRQTSPGKAFATG